MLIDCPRCGRKQVEAHESMSHICVDCAKADQTRVSYYRNHQGDWLAEAKEHGIDPWVQQPDETQWEYTVWCTYRDSYPGKKPSYADVAALLNTTVNVVKKVAMRWTFPARMQAWMKHVDDITLTQRRQQIIDMNSEHINMAMALNAKIKEAIDSIDPLSVKPGEIASLMKTAADLERKARVDTIAQDELRRDLFAGGDNPDMKKAKTSVSDLSEVANILLKAGALGNMNQLGVKQTVTTEVVMKEE